MSARGVPDALLREVRSVCRAAKRHGVSRDEVARLRVDALRGIRAALDAGCSQHRIGLELHATGVGRVALCVVGLDDPSAHPPSSQAVH